MPTDLTVDAALEFTLDLAGARTISGSLTGSGKHLQLRISDPSLFAGRSDASAVRGIADTLASQGLSVTVVTPAGPLVALGVVPRTSWLQRRVTGSRHIRVAAGAGLWRLLRGRLRVRGGGALPAAGLAPPATMFHHRPPSADVHRPPITTPEDPHRGGNFD